MLNRNNSGRKYGSISKLMVGGGAVSPPTYRLMREAG